MRRAQARLHALRGLERAGGQARPPVDRTLATRKLLAAARGARLCYGEPVHVEGRTVIPVARVRAAGGMGQRGGGGRLDAVPVGFIEVSQAGARFEAIGAGGAGPARRWPPAARR